MGIDYALFNELLKVCIGVCVFLMMSCFVYILKNVISGLFHLDDISLKTRQQEIRTIIKQEIDKKK